MHAGGGTNDRGEKRNVLIVSVLLLIGSYLLRSNTQRRIHLRNTISIFVFDLWDCVDSVAMKHISFGSVGALWLSTRSHARVCARDSL